jgi:hypothetical protein
MGCPNKANALCAIHSTVRVLRRMAMAHGVAAFSEFGGSMHPLFSRRFFTRKRARSS